MSTEPARKRFTEFTERTTPIPDVELDEFSATLPPATIDDMIGEGLAVACTSIWSASRPACDR